MTISCTHTPPSRLAHFPATASTHPYSSRNGSAARPTPYSTRVGRSSLPSPATTKAGHTTPDRTRAPTGDRGPGSRPVWSGSTRARPVQRTPRRGSREPTKIRYQRREFRASPQRRRQRQLAKVLRMLPHHQTSRKISLSPTCLSTHCDPYTRLSSPIIPPCTTISSLHLSLPSSAIRRP